MKALAWGLAKADVENGNCLSATGYLNRTICVSLQRQKKLQPLKPTVINFTELRTPCEKHIYYRITCTNKNERRENPGSNNIESKDGVLPGRFNGCQK